MPCEYQVQLHMVGTKSRILCAEPELEEHEQRPFVMGPDICAPQSLSQLGDNIGVCSIGAGYIYIPGRRSKIWDMRYEM